MSHVELGNDVLICLSCVVTNQHVISLPLGLDGIGGRQWMRALGLI